MSKIEGIEEWELRWLYDTKEMSIPELASYYGVSINTIWLRMKEYGISRRSFSESAKLYKHWRKYSINEDFFKTWTPESAWVYGWILGDGNITNINQLRITLARSDEELLYKIRTLMNSNHPVVQYDRWDKRYLKYYYSSTIVFCSKILVDDLKQLSIYDVPECYFNQFLRGFFEAEGHVGWNKRENQNGGLLRTIFTQNNYDMLDFIYFTLKELGVVYGGSIYQTTNTWQLNFSRSDSSLLYHYMYDDCGNMFLERKKDKFEELIRRQEYGV